MALKTSFISSSKTARALGVAAIAFATLNVAVGLNLEPLLEGSSADEAFELDRRVQAFPHKAQVEVLTLGTSHGVAGLRPQTLAPALGLTADRVFNLSLPGSTVLELQWVLDRYAPHFPRARRVIVGFDSFLLTNARSDTRSRYLSRSSLGTRWQLAQHAGGPTDQFHLMAAWFFPLADFSGYVRQRAEAGVKQALKLAPPGPPTYRQRFAKQAYAHGFPPSWDFMTAGELAEFQRKAFTRAALRERATEVMPIQPLTHQLDDFDTFLETARRHERQVSFVEMPRDDRLPAMLRADERRRAEANAAAWQAHVAKRGWHFVPLSAPWPRSAFYDTDHLTPAGARIFANWVQERLPAYHKRQR